MTTAPVSASPRFNLIRWYRSSPLRRIIGRSAGTIGLGILLIMVSMAVFAPWLAPYDPNAQSLLSRLKPPVFAGGTWKHILGTDHLGRDLLSV
jgi:peptide/nickel transport system permease protein